MMNVLPVVISIVFWAGVIVAGRKVWRFLGRK